MTNHKHSALRAAETVTFRCTFDEKLLIDRLAQAEGKTRTDLILDLVAQRAEQTGIDALSPKPTARHPGRPKKLMPETSPVNKIEHAAQSSVNNPEHAQQKIDREHGQFDATDSPMTFGELVAHFREHFADRADGTRAELDDTIRFFCEQGSDGETLLCLDMPLEQLSSQKLIELRSKMARTNLRMAKMNLCLTYLRMVLHFASKQLSLNLCCNPGDYLKPFTVTEIPQSWPGRRN